MRKDLLAVSILALALGGAELRAQQAPSAQAAMKNAQGQSVGSASLRETARGVLMRIELTGLPPGPHGFHIHAVGRCEPPFTSAGGHYNPENKKHGFGGEGAHAGDLPNIHVPADGKATIEVLAAGVTLGSGGNSLFDQDGSSLVVHAGADDYMTDPAGNSGDRIACGIIEKS